MATVLIRFDGGDVPVVTGAIPPDDATPITNPTPAGYMTNQTVIVDAAEYCFGLDTQIAHTPLWRTVQAVDGVPAAITFRKRA
jgi:hypothetical protein